MSYDQAGRVGRYCRGIDLPGMNYGAVQGAFCHLLQVHHPVLGIEQENIEAFMGLVP